MQDYVEVPLTRGRVALIDTQDMLIVGRFLWAATPAGSDLWYAVRSFRVNGKCGSESMHRRIMEPPPGFVVDHINHDGLDNRRSNLRLATVAQNTAHSRPKGGGTSKFHGVHWNKSRSRWRACIRINGMTKIIGSFSDEQRAAERYDEIAKEIHGDFATLNFPESK